MIKTDNSPKNKIIEQKKIEGKSDSKEQYAESILKAVPDLIFILDDKGVFIDLKSGDTEDLAMPKELFIGKSIFKVLPESITAQVKVNLNKVLQEKKVETFEYQMPTKKGIGFYECKMSIFDNKRVIAIVRNITERKQAEDRLKEKIVELEKINKIMVSRELKMVELKEKIKKYETKI